MMSQMALRHASGNRRCLRMTGVCVVPSWSDTACMGRPHVAFVHAVSLEKHFPGCGVLHVAFQQLQL